MSSTHASSRTGSRILLAAVAFLILPALVVFPSGARTDINHIQAGDMIFVYEQNLDITGLRTFANPVTQLRKYQDDNPTMALLLSVPVSDDTSFSPIPEFFGGTYGVYYAWNPTNGVMNSIVVNVPSVSIDAVLASPNHTDSIQGLSIPEDTRIAFKIVSVNVGSSYHAGAVYPATVDLVLTTPGGAQITTIQGMNFAGMNVSSQVFYTDDAGRPGAITLQGLGRGTFSVQAKWSNPPSFDMQAPDSNILAFNIGGSTVAQTTPVPATTVVTTQATTVSTPFPTTTRPTTPPTTAPVTSPPTLPPVTATATATPQPTATPLGAGLAVLAPAFGTFLLIRGRKGA
jgi:Domain of unknown function (DUF3821)